MYDRYRYALTRVCSLLNSDTCTSVRIVGNSSHPAYANVLNEMPPPRFGSEEVIDQADFVKSEVLILDWSVAHYRPKLYAKNVAVLRYGDVLLVSTVPNLESTIQWRDVFGDNFGLLAKVNELPANAPESASHHQRFRIPAGEGMTFPRYPRLFKAGAGVPKSGVMLKKKTTTEYFAKGYEDNDDDVAKSSPSYKKYKAGKCDAGQVIVSMVPIVPEGVCTYHHAQGSTHRNTLHMDLKKLKSSFDDRLIHEREGTNSAILVGITRANRVENTVLSNVDDIVKTMRDEDKRPETQRRRSMHSWYSKIQASYEAYR